MTFVPALVAFTQATALPAPGVGETIAAAKAIAASELTPWRKLHPKADLALTFTDPTVPPAFAGAIRKGFGYKTAMPTLDAAVLTLVLGPATRPAPKQVSMEAYVFLGSFPKGYRAQYTVDTGGRVPRVLTRTILDKYEITRTKPNT